MIYFVPDSGSHDRLVEQLSRAQIPFEAPGSIRDLILSTNNVPLAVCSVSDVMMGILARHATQFFSEELPLVLHDVPGVIYQSGWMTSGSVFPPANFTEFTRATAKSGLLSVTPEQMATRNVGTPVTDRAQDFLDRLKGAPVSTSIPPSTPEEDADAEH